ASLVVARGHGFPDLIWMVGTILCWTRSSTTAVTQSPLAASTSAGSVDACTLAPPLRKPNTLLSGKLAMYMDTLQLTIVEPPFSLSVRSVRVPSTWKAAVPLASSCFLVGTPPPAQDVDIDLAVLPKTLIVVDRMRSRIFSASAVLADMAPMLT